LAFVHHKTPNNQIIYNFKHILPLEKELKSAILELLDNKIYPFEITQEMRDELMEYAGKNLFYFDKDFYYEKSLKILFTALHHFSTALLRTYFVMKSQLLKYQSELA
jgi:hypothetical protein